VTGKLFAEIPTIRNNSPGTLSLFVNPINQGILKDKKEVSTERTNWGYVAVATVIK
jgi:hypothetical protein